MKFPLFLALAFSFSAYAQNESVYTSVAQQDCRVTENSQWQRKPEIDYLTMFCPGVDGYSVKISGGDLRYPLSLIYGNKEIALTEIGAFHELGAKKIEWRGTAGRYDSLIYRMMIADENGEMSPSLYVVRLNGRKSCVIGVVPQSPNMNEQAREIADRADAACL